MEPRMGFGGGAQYPVAMELKYKINSKTPRVGMGRTIWMSSREVVFTADQVLKDNTLLEISIAWPALLHGRVALQLVLEARVAGAEGSQMTARIMRHHFRTRGPWQREEPARRPVEICARAAAASGAREMAYSR